MANPGWDGNHEHFTKPARSLRFRPRRRWRLPAGLFLVVVIGLLFWLIPPVQTEPGVQVVLTGATIPYTPPPTMTPLPRPTHQHGGRIVFTCTRGDVNQLCAVNADGSDFGRLSNNTAHDYYPNFSPQGDALVFASNRGGSFDLYLLVISSNTLIQLTDYIGNAYAPDFSPDGQQIVFANRAAEGPSSLWVVGRKGDDPHLLYAGPNPIVGVAWSPRGDQIAFAMGWDSPTDYQIFLLDVNNPQQPRLVTQGLGGITGSIDWSPDAASLLICAGPINSKDIFRLDLATGGLVQLTQSGNIASATYSPDGQWIAYNAMQPDAQTDLFVMRADGADPKQITNDPEPDWQPQWWP